MANIRKKAIILALINLGVVSLLAQVLLIKELVISFYGNELFIGLLFAFWLISTGAGSLWLAPIFKNKLDRALLWLHILMPLTLVSAIILARISRIILTSSGVMTDIIWACLWSILVIAPTGLLLGILFVILAKIIKAKNNQAVSFSYIIESMGFFIGALVFNFFIFQFTSLMIATLLAIISFILALLFSFKYSLKVSIIIAGLIILISLSLSQAGLIDRELNKKYYPGQKLISSVNSKYGSIQVTQANQQLNFYYNGYLLDNTQNKYGNELLAHLPALLIPEPRSALIIGNGLTGLVEEASKHPLKNITYLELDKAYYHVVKDWLGPGDQANLDIIHQDARTYFNKTTKYFDLIIINYSNPSTLAENRYFTKEFFLKAKSHLSQQGITAIKINTTPNYSIGAQNKLLNTVYQTLNSVMPSVIALPDNEVLFLASNRKIAYNLFNIREKYKKLKFS